MEKILPSGNVAVGLVFNYFVGFLRNILPSKFNLNTELNDLRKMICLRKTQVSVERISVYKIIESLVQHGRHCLPCSTKFSMTILSAMLLHQ